MSDTPLSLFLGGAPEGPQALLLNRANRHGLVAGATGTGKTVTLQIMAEGFARAGVPVFAADIKGDLTGLATPGDPGHKLHAKLTERAAKIGLDPFTYGATPTVLWDVFGKNGHPVRATVAEMGPVLIARMLELNDVQEGVLTIAFQLADDEELLLLDLKDLQQVLIEVSKRKDELSQRYGNVAPQTVAAIQRQLLMLEREGATDFFGEPALELSDLMRKTPEGVGYVNILDATTLINKPRLYATFLLWLLSELFEQLPEVGDPDKPKLVFFFDEAHLLFTDAPRSLLQKVEQVVRLIRSKGVGVYFVTQNPRDVPETVLAQLGNRIQHALRAYTPLERKAVKSAAESFRPNPAFDTETVITELGTGEALVSTLDAKGAPTMVARTLIRPPSGRLGPITDAERAELRRASPVGTTYDTVKDRKSAYEVLKAKEERLAKEAEREAAREARENGGARSGRGEMGTRSRTGQPRSSQPRSRSRTNRTLGTVLNTIAREVTRYLLRGVLGGGGRRPRR
jgi:DNA helicase HerA-like ATPase